MDLYNIYLLYDWLISLSIMMFSSSSSVLSCPPVLHLFLLLNTILLYGYTTFYLFCSLNSCFLLEVLPYNINSDITCGHSSRLYHKVEEIENFLFVSCVLGLNAKQISDSLNSETVLVLCKA